MKKVMQFLGYGYYLVLTIFTYSLITTSFWYPSNIILKMFYFILFMVMAFLIVIFINLPFLALKRYIIEKHKIKKEKELAKLDVQDIEYFRDKIPGASPGILSFVMDLKINPVDDIIATLFSLKIRNYLEIVDNKITVIKDDLEISKNERYIIEKHNVIFNDKKILEEWKRLVIEDSINKGFINRRSKKKNLISFRVAVMIIITLIILFFGTIDSSISFEIICNLIVIAFFGLIINSVLSLINNSIYANNKYIRTNDGYILLSKLYGLNKFLRDFSSIESRLKEQVVLWEDYMIYAIIFNYPGTLNNDVITMYNEIKKIKCLK